MARSHTLAVHVAGVSIALLVAMACSSPGPAPGDQGSSSGTSGTSGGGTSNGGLPTGSTSGTQGTPDAGDVDSRCVAAGKGCADCCTDVHATGSKAYDTSLIKCICTSPGACKTECATTMCTPQALQPDVACDACVRTALGAGGQCLKQVNSECIAVPDCAAVNACIGKCP